jgi:putative mRNA 3-end processing factor
MAVRGAKNRRSLDQGFVLSDHADWVGLQKAVAATDAQKVFVTHGFTSVFSRWLNEINIPAAEVKTMYGEEEEEKAEKADEENPLTNDQVKE